MLGARALQISMGAPPLIETDATDPIEIAMEEFAKDLVPMTPTRLPYARH
jgi:DNA-directed RNA polymerase subunit K